MRLGVFMDLLGDFMGFHGGPLRPSTVSQESQSIYKQRETTAPAGIPSTVIG